jgi:hypothetical protein
MLLDKAKENGNNEFSKSCLTWLRESPSGPRTRCLFIEDGDIKNRFALPMPEPPIPPFDQLANTFLHHANDVINEMEDRNWFNQQLLQGIGKVPIVVCFLLCVTTALVIVGLFRLWNSRARPDPSVSMAAQVRPFLPRGTAVRQRHSAQIDTGNLYELARDRVRRQFAFLDDAEDHAGEKAPGVIVAPGVAQARRLRREAQRLWTIGYGTKPVRVSRREWSEFKLSLERVVRAAEDGCWRFESAPDK